jgi:hypothetical protein
MTPTVIVLPRLNRRAAGLGVNANSSDTARIRSRVRSLTICIPFIARDAVATLTPARRATSRIVTAFFTDPPVTGYMQPVTEQLSRRVKSKPRAERTDHVFIDDGHVIDYLNKACEAAAAIGDDGWALLPPTLVRATASATRYEEVSEWREPVDLIPIID